ncbi:MAG: SDR family oxidoreductase [Acetobacteraceae bacterium]|nr:SDR family oxidoreductase [Acetobacteraceae bacterium]
MALLRLVTFDEVGAACVVLTSAYAAMTGERLYIDGGYHGLA